MMIFKGEGKGPFFLPYSFTGICNGTQLTNPNNKSQLSREIDEGKYHLKESFVRTKKTIISFLLVS